MQRTIRRPMVIGLCAIVASGAHAAPADTCKTTGVANATNLSFDAGDARLLTGIAISLQLGLEPGSFPAEDIAAMVRPCRRFDVDIGSDRYTIYGEDSDSPPRWALGPDKSRVAYLALMPDPSESADWLERRKTDPNAPASFKSALHALVMTDGDRRLVFQFLRGIPDNYLLAMSFKAVLEGRLKPVAVYDVKTHASDLSSISLAGQQVSSEGLGPQPLRVERPDGRIFATDGRGGAHHGASGLPCPAEIGAFRLEKFHVYDPTEGGRDVACRFFGERAWFSVYATRIPNKTLDAMFEAYRTESQRVAPVAANLSAPGLVIPKLQTRSVFWSSTQGSNQGMWLTRRDEWYYKVRVTYQAGSEGEVTEFARTMLAAIDDSRP